MIDKFRYNFDNSGEPGLTKDELFNIIRRVEHAGYHVVSVSSDGGTKNQGLATALGISHENPRFPHPHRDGWSIYWFWDPPHILKKCRDHLVDKGYNLPAEPGETKTFLGKDRLKKLLKKLEEGNDITVGFKLTMFHIEVREQG